VNKKQLIEKAKKKARAYSKKRKDPRFLKTIGKLKKAGYIDAPQVPPTGGLVFLTDALWTAKIEPRIYEILPAILLKHPKFFAYINLPEDLSRVVRELRIGKPKTFYHEVSPELYERWIPFVAQNGRYPSVMRSFRFYKEDLLNLKKLQKETGLTQSAVLRTAIEKMLIARH
jgi:hypothetical protein